MTRTDAVLAAKQIDRQIATAAEVMPPGNAQITLFAVRPIVEALAESLGYSFREHNSIDISQKPIRIFAASKDVGEVYVCVQGSEPING